ncbi:hypothetical protein FOTG_18827 [Fusarium oxysporum f. sp. vasinfectum 25433]|uniref:Alcohol dehydrogenase-like N-terminal domain-containing protein n=1 Tax=Fusarium oxysporum f. sp. vasinfectum 25433 TaxID=1089449 RepID=X0KGQ1_FUSOX|nr:hypothetical protein FOTG_18827 [Fusarium oxysporum f. sp. vasinfectum 25433]
MSTDHKFEGWIAYNKDSAKGNLQWGTYKPKPFLDTNIDIAKPADYPLVIGHEIIGHAVRVGKNVKSIKIGDRVGVGA